MSRRLTWKITSALLVASVFVCGCDCLPGVPGLPGCSRWILAILTELVAG